MISNRKEILGNVIFWIILLSLLYYTLGQQLRLRETAHGLEYSIIYDPFTFLLLVIDMLGKIAFFYVNLFILVPKYYHKKNYKKYFLYASFLFFSTLLITVSIEWGLMVLLQRIFEEISFYIPYIVLFHVIIVPLSIAYADIKEKIRSDAHSKLLLEEKLNAELNYLKHQLNPHFLFNTLNNIFSMTQKHEDKTAANSISQLSRMMRYMLYESNTDKIDLNKELKYIEDFIALEKIRILKSDAIKINTTYNIAQKDCLIAPMLLIPLIENAFKHGISYTKTSSINIDINWNEDERIILSVNNINHANGNHNKDANKGIGLVNLKNRLELLYPDKYELKVQNENNIYSSSLIINLKSDD